MALGESGLYLSPVARGESGGGRMRTSNARCIGKPCGSIGHKLEGPSEKLFARGSIQRQNVIVHMCVYRRKLG